jgi:arylformamidase
MCDPAGARGRGWRGWKPIPEPVAGIPDGPWLDLSHRLNAAMPRVPTFPPPVVRKRMCMPADPLNVTEFSMVVHTGTHIDAPRHFFEDGPALEGIPLPRLHGPGVVWGLDGLAPESLIEVSHLEAARPLLRPGDILALDTGWSRLAGTEAYEAHPSLSLDAAAWLVDRAVKLLACDFPTPDMPVHRRPPGFDWPVHKRLLGDGVLICEHLRGHIPLSGRRAEFMLNALNIEGSDGAPARVLARAVRD